MKTYNGINDFIIEMFPQEYEKIVKRNLSPVERSIEKINSAFDEELESIIKGKKQKDET